MKIQKRANGKYRVQYYMYTDEKGKAHMGSRTFTTELEAELFREQVYAERKRRKSIDKSYDGAYESVLLNAVSQGNTKRKKQAKKSILDRNQIGNIRKDLPKSVEEELKKIDKMSGIEFENYIISLLKLSGMFYGGEIINTNITRDYGADILLTTSNGIKVAIQCKRMQSKVHIDSVQEVFSGASYYQAQYGAVITNNYFSPNGITLAKKNKVFLIDRDKLAKIIQKEIEFTNNLLYGNQWLDLMKYIDSDVNVNLG